MSRDMVVISGLFVEILGNTQGTSRIRAQQLVSSVLGSASAASNGVCDVTGWFSLWPKGNEWLSEGLVDRVSNNYFFLSAISSQLTGIHSLLGCTKLLVTNFFWSNLVLFLEIVFTKRCSISVFPMHLQPVVPTTYNLSL